MGKWEGKESFGTFAGVKFKRNQVCCGTEDGGGGGLRWGEGRGASV